MQWDCGSITTSQHPILGALIHFTPRNSTREHGLRTRSGSIDTLWVCRTWDNLSVADKIYNWRHRGFVEDLENDWGRKWSRAPVKYLPIEEEGWKKSAYAFKGEDLPQPILRPSMPRPRSSQGDKVETQQFDHLDDIPRGLYDGEWTFGAHPTRVGPSSDPALVTYSMPGASSLDSERLVQARRKPTLHRRVIVAIYDTVKYFLGKSALRSVDHGSERDMRQSSRTRVSSSIHVQERKCSLGFQTTVEDDLRSPSQISLPLSMDSAASIDTHPSPVEYSSLINSSRWGRKSRKEWESMVASITEQEDATTLERQRLALELIGQVWSVPVLNQT